MNGVAFAVITLDLGLLLALPARAAVCNVTANGSVGTSKLFRFCPGAFGGTCQQTWTHASKLFLALAILLFADWSNALGQTAKITDARIGADGRFVLHHAADPNFYYILRKGEQVTAILTAKDIQLGQLGNAQLKDPDLAVNAGFYRVQQAPITTPLDTDGDGIDDVYELKNRPLLDPLNPSDAAVDPDRDGKTTLEEYRVGRNPFVAEHPAVPTIVYPTNATTASFVMFSGQGPKNTLIRVEGGAAYVTNSVDSTGAFELTVPLNPNRLNRLFVSAVDDAGETSAPVPVDILQDSTPPYLFIDFPASNAVLTSETTLVAGRVGDALSGFLGLNVTINGQLAQVDIGIGPNGTYQRSVPLIVGPNTIEIVATDRLGNGATRRITVTRELPAGPRLIAVSGDLQQTNILRRLSQPLVVKATQANGAAMANKAVRFQVTRSDGRLLPVDTNSVTGGMGSVQSSPSWNSNGVLALEVSTDANGEARVWWTMGTDAGHANNRVTVSAADIQESAYFCASASALPAKQINIGSGNSQRGETLGPAPEPLKVWVSDGNNPVAGIPVTFRVVQGGGTLVPIVGSDGASPAGPGLRGSRPTGSIALHTTLKQQALGLSEVTVLTGATGHSEVDYTFGPDAGDQIIEASFPGNAGLPATFILKALARTAGQPTSFTGLIFDNTSAPIGGALCELVVNGGTNVTVSNPEGYFAFPNIAAGAGHLKVNGATATTLGTNSIPTNSFPFLQYTTAIVPNAENTLPTPVLLPRLNTNNAQWYYGTNDLILTCQGIGGLKMTIKANSMKHPNGQLVDPAHPAFVSLNQVHHDDIPMPMPDGASPPFAWTLQPGGATFEPPVQVEYPNMSGLAPGAAAFFLTFNHDTERFEIVASGHVVDDGSKIISDPGAGLTISGWGCNCPPYSATGSCENKIFNISGPDTVEVAEEITLSANDPVTWTVTAQDGAVKEVQRSSSSITLRGETIGRVDVTAQGDDSSGEKNISVVACSQNQVSDQLPSSLQGGGWTIGSMEISDDDGLVIRDVSLQGRYMARIMSVPYILVELKPGGGPKPIRVELQRDSGDKIPRCRLIKTASSGGASVMSVLATYLIDHLPSQDSSAKLCVTMKYLFFKHDPQEDCNSLSATCARFCPMVSYEFKPGDGGQVGLGKITIPQRFEFSQDHVERNNGGLARDFPSPACLPFSNPGTHRLDFFPACQNPAKHEFKNNAWGGFLPSPDSYHQTKDAFITTPDPSTTPPTSGCPDCIHIHWRWGNLVGLNNPSFFINAGQPMIPAGSPQNVIVGHTLFHPGEEDPNDWQSLVNSESYSPGGERLVFWYEGSSSATRDDFFRHGGFFLPPPSASASANLHAHAAPASVGGIDPALSLSSPVLGLSPPALPILDDSWLLSVAGQTVRPDANGGFSIPNVTAPDLFGPEGPGSIPDFLSDDPVRITGVSTKNGINRYVQSRFFRIKQGGSISVSDLTFSTTQPLAPESLRGTATLSTLTKLGQQTQLTVVGSYSDGSQKDLTASGEGTTYRTSNLNIVSVSPDGLVTATGRGPTFLTAVNQGATTVVAVDVVPGDQLTTVIGLVQDSSGKPVAGAEVTLTGLAARAVTGPDGRFVVNDVPTTIPNISITAQLTVGGERQIGTISNLTLVPGQITDAGLISILPAPSFSNGLKVATGRSHTLVIEADGSLWAWGFNSSGQLGDGTTLTRFRPVRVGADNDWSAVVAEESHSLALKTDGRLWGWGDNFRGALGDGTQQSRSVPTQIGTDKDWVSVATGGDHTLAVKRDGSLWAWGGNRQGQLGDGTQNPSLVPKQIGTDTDWASVSAAADHSTALKQNGTFWIWGDADVFRVSVPQQVGGDVDWIGLANGRRHVVLLKADGGLWVMGHFRTLDAAGRLVQQSSVPLRIGTDNDWATVAAGNDTTFAIKQDGSLWAIGGNQVGQLGAGTIIDQVAFVSIASGQRWRAVASKADHAIALKTDGAYYSWGWNASGALGLGFDGSNQPTPKQIGTDTDWESVAISQTDMLAIKTSGALWGWGGNFNGGLGDSSNVSRSTPVRIGNDTDWSAITFGHRHTLGLKRGGTLWAWGENGSSQLGVPTTGEIRAPVQVGSDVDWVATSAAAFHSFAIKGNGTLWGWGENFSGQLGDGTKQAKSTPSQIGSDRDWNTIAASPGHALARKADGSLWAWGQNAGGQLGLGTTSASPVPVRVGTDLDWSALIAATELHSVALKSDGSAWICGADLKNTGTSTKSFTRLGTLAGWRSVGLGGNQIGTAYLMLVNQDGTLWGIGANSRANLGDSTSVDKDSLTQIGTSTDWRFVAAGDSATAAVKVDGTLWTWGNAEFARLGDLSQFLPHRVGNASEWVPKP
ncbi:MAG: hypothetical protein L0Z50_29650 [Verrucomicrobiales bacterium]|nr:hypothetical protein [Verrucomicrobiales bacterium]